MLAGFVSLTILIVQKFLTIESFGLFAMFTGCCTNTVLQIFEKS